MKAKIKGTTEWKDYKEAFGQYGELIGLETKGYTLTDEEWCKEKGITYDPDCPFNEGMHYVSAILPLEAFDLPNEIDWQFFRTEAAKDILCATLSGGIASGMIDMIAIIQEKESIVNGSIEIADELVKALKEKEEG